jgi:thiamine-phosphate diphosphorylase
VRFPIDRPIIYLITKGESTASNFSDKRREIIDIIKLAVEEKVSFIQLREKNLPARLLFELTNEAVRITRTSATRVFVNDRADIAFAAKADGVHLAADSLPVDVIRSNFSTDLIIGVSTHSVDAAINASAHGADFVVFGPVFVTPNKGQPFGTDVLAEVCETVRPFPVLALGGIQESNVSSIFEAGASGFAAIRTLNDPDSMRSICRKLDK